MKCVFLPLTLFAQGENWIYRYNGPGNAGDYANSLVYGVNGNIYAAGYSWSSGTYTDFTVISLAPDFVVEEESNFAMKNCYSATICSGPLHLPNNKNCKVFDITGRVVMPDRLKPGVYFIQIDNKIIRKIVKVR